MKLETGKSWDRPASETIENAISSGFTPDVEPGWREQGSAIRVEVDRAIFAEPREQLGMTFSWPEQRNVLELAVEGNRAREDRDQNCGS